jgi:arginyl-tRNA synthetase
LGSLYREADISLDFSLLTQYPHPGLLTAEVISFTEHLENEKWKVVQLQVGIEQYQVICGGKDYEVGSYVAYAPPGTKVAGRLVEGKDMLGVKSEGMICSETELNLGKDRDKIHCFEGEVKSGISLTEFGRVDGALAPEIPVVDEMNLRLNQVSSVLKQLEDKSSPIQNLWKETRQWSLDDFKDIYNWIDCRFDHYFFESEVGDEGKNIVLKALDEGLLQQSEGTVGADLSEDKLGYLMLLKSDGTGLYATKDIALAKRKFEEFKIDRSIYVVDYSQSLHFSQVFKCLEKLGYPQAKKCYHLAYGQVTLPEGKMSSRKGTVVYFSQLKNELTQHIKAEHLKKHEDNWSTSEIDDAARKIAIATIKYGMLNQDNIKNIVFDMNEWTSLSGNTGPYLLYAYARTQSIQRKVGKIENQTFQGELLTQAEERALLTALSNFKAQVQRSIEQNKPQLICIYLYNLSRDFSRMFENCPVAKAENEALKYSRLMLVKSTGLVLKQGLSLLGIKTLEQM